MTPSADMLIQCWQPTVPFELDESSRVTMAGVLSTGLQDALSAHHDAPDDDWAELGPCFRLTGAGRFRKHWPGYIAASPYLRDLLELCEGGATLDHLRQWMPPVSLRRSLRTLLEDGLIEQHAMDQPARRVA